MAELLKHINTVVKASGKKSLFAMIFSMEGLKMMADGNIGYIKLIKGPTAGTLVGEDHLGNKYYENDNLPYGRKRWVLYKDTFDYTPSGVPAEWHGWLNYINDFAPTKYDFKKPMYAVEAYVTKTGTSESYAPKGVWANPSKRNWKKYEAWQPPQSS